MSEGSTANAKAALLSMAPALPPTAQPTAAGGVRKAAEEFEAVFLAEMLRPMFDHTSPQPPFGGGFGEDVWKSMLADEYGKALVQRGGTGLADTIASELLRAQEAAQSTSGANSASIPGRHDQEDVAQAPAAGTAR